MRLPAWISAPHGFPLTRAQAFGQLELEQGRIEGVPVHIASVDKINDVSTHRNAGLKVEIFCLPRLTEPSQQKKKFYHTNGRELVSV